MAEYGLFDEIGDQINSFFGEFIDRDGSMITLTDTEETFSIINLAPGQSLALLDPDSDD